MFSYTFPKSFWKLCALKTLKDFGDGTTLATIYESIPHMILPFGMESYGMQIEIIHYKGDPMQAAWLKRN